MSNIIKLLPNSVINQIAAGQVVHRPASVVKEMMENAIDAGATELKVNFRDGGLELMTISDNGRGMSPEDARLAFERHSTSKIGKVEDLYALTSFGFRGEALASIAAVAEVEVITREATSHLGTKISISGGKFLGQESVAAQPGTMFRVSNLFYNTPAQRRFLDKSSTEERHITAEFRRVALCHPSVACTLYKNDAPLMTLPAATLKGRVAAVAGKHIASTLLDLSTRTTLVEIEGFVTTPEAARQRNSEQFFFVNGRFFRSGYFHKAVMSAYDKLIPAGTQPAYFIYLKTDPDRIDVNIHPQKTEVKFDDQSAIFQIINASVRESLAKLGVVPMLNLDPRSNIEIPVAGQRHIVAEPQYASNPSFNPFDESPRPHGMVADGVTRGGADGSNASDPYIFSRPPAGKAPIDEVFAGKGYPFVGGTPTGELQDGDDGAILDYIRGEDDGQTAFDTGRTPGFYDHMPLSERYLAANLGGQLALVDIARAWEAILYDKYRALLSQSSSVSQRLLFPEEVVLSADDVELLQGYIDDFSLCGFEIEVADLNRILLHGIPADFTPQSVTELIYDMLDALRVEGASAPEVKATTLAAAIARRGAAMRRGAYTKEELGAMLATLESSSSPRFTPSGKAIIATLTNNDIKNLLE